MKIKLISLIAIYLLGLVCSTVLLAQETSKLGKSTPIKIVFVNDNAPFSFTLPDGTATGLYVEFWQLWSQTNQIPIKLIPETIKNNFALLRSHKVDFHVGLFSNDERKTWGGVFDAYP